MKIIREKINNYENRDRCIKDIIPLPTSVLRVFGMWPSSHWNLFSKFLYSFITVFVLIFMILDVVTLFCVIYFAQDPIQTFFESCFFIFSVLCTLCKAACVLIKHNKIVLLFKMLLERQCQPRDSEEIALQNETDNEGRWVFKVYASMISLSLSAMFIEPILKSGDERIKALNTWRPFDLNVPLYFWITYFQQMISHPLTPCVHMSVECLISGFMQQACAQIKILQHRLKLIPELVVETKNQKLYKHIDLEHFLFSENVRHHIHILAFTKFFNRTFVEIMFIQCVMSLALICASVYQMSMQSIFSVYFLNILTFNVCMMMQLFLFCWYGNELMLQSNEVTETLYEMNWTLLRHDTKMNIFTMMICNSSPIVISSGAVIKLNICSFLAIIKASYSAFNVLQQAVKN